MEVLFIALVVASWFEKGAELDAGEIDGIPHLVSKPDITPSTPTLL
jgi:hypothetical protein